MLVLSCIVFVRWSSLSGQIEIAGMVVDAGDRLPLVGVNIRLQADEIMGTVTTKTGTAGPTKWKLT